MSSIYCKLLGRVLMAYHQWSHGSWLKHKRTVVQNLLDQKRSLQKKKQNKKNSWLRHQDFRAIFSLQNNQKSQESIYQPPKSNFFLWRKHKTINSLYINHKMDLFLPEVQTYFCVVPQCIEDVNVSRIPLLLTSVYNLYVLALTRV